MRKRYVDISRLFGESRWCRRTGGDATQSCVFPPRAGAARDVQPAGGLVTCSPGRALLDVVVDSPREDVSQDRVELTVDAMVFSVAYDRSQPGTYHYIRLPGVPGGPAVGYGFSSRWSTHERQTVSAHIEALRDFISMVDPATGYIEDDEDGVEDD